MFETNEEVTRKLKEAIHDYYMGYIKQKLKASLANGKEAEISSQIMQFLDAQIDTGNSTITKDDISRILSSILIDGYSESFHSDTFEKRISHCFPNVSDIKIENGNAAYLKEVFDSPINGTTEKSCYLYVSPDYYNDNIGNIESEIKKLEKGFSRQDFKNFEQKFKEDLSLKQYELESSRVYESASRQIELKKQKFKVVSSKMINDYGRKFAEITAKDISDEEKEVLYEKLLDETKSYDEKNRQAVARLNSEYEKLSENFQGKVQDSKTTYSQMQNLHLFDKNRYFEDMMAETEPKLRDLYKKRYLLNSYRTAHGEPVYSGKSNAFMNFVTTAFNNIRYKNAPLMLGPHFERDFSNGIQDTENDSYDKNLVRALASFYGNAVQGDTFEFENCLTDYFKTNYKEITQNANSNFFFKFSDISDENTDISKEGDLIKIAKYFDIDTSNFENHFGANLVIKDELVYEENNGKLNVIYASNKAINNVIEDLHGASLYYKDLASQNILASNNNAKLQNAFMDYANANGIEVENSYASSQNTLVQKKRFVKRKSNENKIIDFKQESC